MMLSGTAQYALRAVLHVAAQGDGMPVRVDAIARALDVPRNYLSKTLHLLARDGVLRSGRGPRGGFQLAVPAGELTLARIAAPFDDVRTRQCLLGHPTCDARHACPLHHRWEALATELRAFFVGTTVADLLRSGYRPAPAPAARRRPSPTRRGGP
jgi:Rrf2 family protein